MIKIKDKIFSKDEVNILRQWELDLARTVIIFCLALIHVTIECTSDEGLCSGIPYLFDTVIGGPFSVPMYMFVMGIGMAYTPKNSPKSFFIRGVKIFVLAYVLNICRFLIPYSAGYALTGDYEVYMEPLIYKVLGNDILTFAGLAMMIMALFIKIGMPNILMIIIAAVMCVFGTLLIGVDAGSPLGNIFLGYLIATEDAAGMVLSYFPILNWMLFPVCGYSFGCVLKHVKNKELFYLTFSLPAAIIAAAYLTWGIHNETGMFGEGQNCYYHMIFRDVIACLCLTVGMIGLYYFIYKFLPPRLVSLAGSISKHITTVYFIHWILVSVIVNLCMYIIRGTTLLTPGQVVALGTVISISSIAIAQCITKRRERGRINEKTS
ncbi:MAG: DUF1624 domain-containing protein [Firmicutes bacterium]|nr:DUF1624 domain-containing protein [Bacillota bacterium]